MKPDDFDFIVGLLKAQSGLVLDKGKVYLLESRLTPVARRRGFETLEELLAHMRRTKDDDLVKTVVEAMTTNESFFFRDNTPFDLFRDQVLPRLLETNAASKKIRIWCAAASSGQEPYSLAMILKDQEIRLKDWRVEILGTDISQQVLDKARAGIYSQFEVQRGLPIRTLVRYFTQQGDVWHLNKDVRDKVTFKEFNLLDSYQGLGQFDVVFCRNVLIYFDQETKSDVLSRLRDVMPPHGVLFLGAAETVLGLTDRFKPVPGQRGLYVTVETPLKFASATASATAPAASAAPLRQAAIRR